MAEELTLRELFAIFDRPATETRFIGSADSQEYLGVVTYLAQRNNREAA